MLGFFPSLIKLCLSQEKQTNKKQPEPVQHFNQANNKKKKSKICSEAATCIVMHWEFFNRSESMAFYESRSILSEFIHLEPLA